MGGVEINAQQPQAGVDGGRGAAVAPHRGADPPAGGVEPGDRQLMARQVGHTPPGGRVRRHRAIQILLAAQRLNGGEVIAAVGEHHHQIP